MILIKGALAASRSVFYTLLLLIAVIYVFSIAFVQLTANSEVGSKYFKDVVDGMFTLLLRGTYLDEVTEFVADLREFSTALVLLFLLYVLLAAHTLMNMLIGVLCEVVSVVAATEKDEQQMGAMIAKLDFILNSLDKNNDRLISKEEFVRLLQNKEATMALQDFGCDPVSLVDLADAIVVEVHG